MARGRWQEAEALIDRMYRHNNVQWPWRKRTVLSSAPRIDLAKFAETMRRVDGQRNFTFITIFTTRQMRTRFLLLAFSWLATAYLLRKRLNT